MSNLFKHAFQYILKEAPELPPLKDELSDADAMKQTLDKGTNPDDFNVDAQTAANHMQATTQMQNQMVGSLKSWIAELERVAEFLNGTGADSVQSKLKACVPDTLFDKIRVAETKKIARVSMEVTGLNEMLKGYLASSQDPKYRGV